jgi:hypothetical protein
MATTSNRRIADESDKPHRGRRLSWAEFAQLTGREPQAANDNADAKAAQKPYITNDDLAAEAA